MEPETILLEDCKQKIMYLTSHMMRMWTRFNLFVTIESALSKLIDHKDVKIFRSEAI